MVSGKLMTESCFVLWEILDVSIPVWLEHCVNVTVVSSSYLFLRLEKASKMIKSNL